MNPSRVLLLIAFALIHTGVCRAQADYLSVVKLYVRDSANRHVPGAKVDVREQFEKQTLVHEFGRVNEEDDHYFVALGLEERGTFPIKVTAPGFEPKEFKVYFIGGQTQTVIVNLKRSGTNERDSLRRTIPLKGVIFDVSGARVANAVVTAVSNAGARFEMKTETNGYFEFALPYNGVIWNPQTKSFEMDAAAITKYDISVTAGGFKPFALKGFVVANTELGAVGLDIIIENVHFK